MKRILIVLLCITMLGCGQQTKSPEAPKEVKWESKQPASGLQEKKDKKEEAPEPEEVGIFNGYLRPALDWSKEHWKPIALTAAVTAAGVFLDLKFNLHGEAWKQVKRPFLWICDKWQDRKRKKLIEDTKKLNNGTPDLSKFPKSSPPPKVSPPPKKDDQEKEDDSSSYYSDAEDLTTHQTIKGARKASHPKKKREPRIGLKERQRREQVKREKLKLVEKPKHRFRIKYIAEGKPERWYYPVSWIPPDRRDTVVTIFGQAYIEDSDQEERYNND